MIGVILAVLGGAGLMYFLDPDAGRRRRALVRDQIVKARHQIEEKTEAAQKQAANKAQGVVAETQSHLRQQPEVDDYTLAARVRSEMGRVVSHSRAIDASVYQGRVTLRGNILADEVDRLMSTVRAVPGVREVDNQLQVHTEPGNIPDLQGSTQQFNSTSQM
jgi:osmotically-inducible protein OsmY